MMAIERVVFETQDGKQFQTLEEAHQYELHEDIKEAMQEGYYGPEFEIDDAIAALLRDFNITRKEKESD